MLYPLRISCYLDLHICIRIDDGLKSKFDALCLRLQFLSLQYFSQRLIDVDQFDVLLDGACAELGEVQQVLDVEGKQLGARAHVALKVFELLDGLVYAFQLLLNTANSFALERLLIRINNFHNLLFQLFHLFNLIFLGRDILLNGINWSSELMGHSCIEH